jgi:predicted hydrolase (HD superfamily)
VYGLDKITEIKNKQRSTRIQYCLAAAETLTGLIVSSALVQPDKRLSSVSLESLKKKFKNKAFAAKCNRNIIMECEKAGTTR